MEARHAQILARLTLLAAVFTLMVIAKGAYTRLTDAGLGCPDWPGCYGFLTVPSGDKVELAEQAFPDTPVEAFKAWVEMIHRYMATVLGVLIVAITVLGVKWAPSDKSQGWPRKHLYFLLFLVCLQGAFGAWTVTLKLLPKIVTLHLIGGFSVLTTLALLSARFYRWSPEREVSPTQRAGLARLLPLGWVALAALCIQIFLGGWTSTNYAALACPDLPKCQGQWWPPTDFKTGFDLIQDVGPNYLGGQLDNDARVAIHLTHRIGAIVVTVLVGALSLLMMVRGGGGFYSRAGALMMAALWVQIALGLSNILYQLPLSVATLHNVGAAVLLQILVLSVWSLRRVAADAIAPQSMQPRWARA